METLLSYLVVMVALVALSSPVWVKCIRKADDEQSYEDRLEEVIRFICEADEETLEQLIILSERRRLLIHIEASGGWIRLV